MNLNYWCYRHAFGIFFQIRPSNVLHQEKEPIPSQAPSWLGQLTLSDEVDSHVHHPKLFIGHFIHDSKTSKVQLN